MQILPILLTKNEFTLKSSIKCTKDACQNVDRGYHVYDFIPFTNTLLNNYFEDVLENSDADVDGNGEMTNFVEFDVMYVVKLNKLVQSRYQNR